MSETSAGASSVVRGGEVGGRRWMIVVGEVAEVDALVMDD